MKNFAMARIRAIRRGAGHARDRHVGRERAALPEPARGGRGLLRGGDRRVDLIDRYRGPDDAWRRRGLIYATTDTRFYWNEWWK